jgi:nucleoside-diphosphate-sugar epimerase
MAPPVGRAEIRILFFGANGFLGSNVLSAALAAGHDVTAFARNEVSARGIAAHGATPVSGSIDDGALLARLAREHDGVVFAARVHFAEESRIVAPMLDAMRDSGKPFVMTSGTSCLSIDTPNGEWNQDSFAEDDPFEAKLWTRVRLESESVVRAAAGQGVRGIVIRPPMIWGNGGGNGQVPWIFQAVPKTGAACYLGLGLNLYTNVHVEDLARLYVAALAQGRAGALYHAVAGEVNWRTIAEAVAEVMDCPARSISYAEMCELWGENDAPYRFAVSSRCRAVATRRDFDWAPRHLDLIDDILNGSYRERFRPQARPQPGGTPAHVT